MEVKYIMEKKKEYKISLLGEFDDKSIENEFLEETISQYSKSTAIIALLFGVLFMLFLGTDYYDAINTSSLLIITFTRVLFLIISIIVFFVTKQTIKYTNYIYLVTAYSAFIAIAYLVILAQYESLRYLSILGLMVVSFAIYILPIKIIYSQIISFMLSILFLIYPAQKIEGLKRYDIYKIAAYQIILLIYCNISTYLTNSYKRKQFVSNRELLGLAVTDPLTGIYNRAKFNEEIEKLVNLSSRYDNPLSLILFDIDNFKRVNDSYGHLVGDSVLKTIVSTINNSIRITDTFARWGGEEFMILLPNTDIWEAVEIAERLKALIQNNLYEPAKEITCSFGVASFEKGDTAQSLIRKTDELLLQAKGIGKNSVNSQLKTNLTP